MRPNVRREATVKRLSSAITDEVLLFLTVTITFVFHHMHTKTIGYKVNSCKLAGRTFTRLKIANKLVVRGKTCKCY